MNDRHRHLLLLLLMLAASLAGCRAEPARECRRSDDCADGEFCRIGFCVPAVGRDRDTRGGSGTGGSQRSDVSPGADDTPGSNPDRPDATPSPEECSEGRGPNAADLVLNELLPNVPAGPDGDANGDGVRDAFDDEFVELVNTSASTLDLDGVTLKEGRDTKTSLDGVCLPPSTALVVFGGLAAGEAPKAPDGARAIVSDKRLGFSNAGGSVKIVRADGAPLAEASWQDPPPQALTLRPQLTGSTMVLHGEFDDTRRFSPGRCADGTAIEDGCPPPAPPPDAGPNPDADAGDIAR